MKKFKEYFEEIGPDQHEAYEDDDIALKLIEKVKSGECKIDANEFGCTIKYGEKVFIIHSITIGGSCYLSCDDEDFNCKPDLILKLKAECRNMFDKNASSRGNSIKGTIRKQLGL